MERNTTQILTEGLDVPALAVHVQAKQSPSFPSALYRLFATGAESAQATIEGRATVIPATTTVALSPGEEFEALDDKITSGVGFHHDFFCVRVRRDEVFCDGVVFNRLAGPPLIALTEAERATAEHTMHELATVAGTDSPLQTERAISALRTLLLQVADAKLRRNPGAPTEEHGLRRRISPLVLDFQSLVEETYHQHRPASFYSTTLGTSLSTLNRKVKDELGQSVKQVVSERLAIEARSALRTGDRSVKEVAHSLGFSDPLYFSRFFKKQFGRSPSAYFADMTGETV